jgi:hypothetical protein
MPMQHTDLIDILKEHPDYRFWKSNLELYADLYAGGAQLKSKSEQYLYRRLREPAEIYQERLNRSFYENHIGSIVDWFASTLFRREPVITVNTASQKQSAFYRDFLNDCDNNGTSITDFCRKKFIQMLVYGKTWIGIEFPKVNSTFHTRLEEESAGADRAFLTNLHPTQVVNWKYDATGKLELLVIEMEKQTATYFTGGQELKSRYLVYTKTEFFLVEKTTSGAESAIRVEDQGQHCCAGMDRVPVVEMELSSGLWLLNKAGHLQLEHYNKLNSLAWSLGTALYTTPVIYSRKEWDQILGESYYIHLEPDDKFTWTEPAGNVFNIAINNLVRLQEEIYRTSHLASQSRTQLSGNAQTSAASKRRDYQVTEEVLRSYGDTIKDGLKKLLDILAQVRQDEVTASVSGLDEFEVGEFADQIAEASELLRMGIGSQTFKAEVFKKLALKFLSDANESVKLAIQTEIEQGIKGDTLDKPSGN